MRVFQEYHIHEDLLIILSIIWFLISPNAYGTGLSALSRHVRSASKARLSYCAIILLLLPYMILLYYFTHCSLYRPYGLASQSHVIFRRSFHCHDLPPHDVSSDDFSREIFMILIYFPLILGSLSFLGPPFSVFLDMVTSFFLKLLYSLSPFISSADI